MKELDRLPIPLLAWYHDNARVLPWRSDPTAYHVWISEIMLQQTRVSAVLDYYVRFLAALPDVEHLAQCPEDELMKLWQGLGYYSRARNLQRAAQQIMDRHGGQFPSGYEDIRDLPGVGDYTAGAISSIAFGQPRPAVDGNVLRVVARLCADRRDVTRPETKRWVTRALEKIIPLDAPGQFNQALMDLGATVCLPNGAPLCEKCPARDFCAGRLGGEAESLPVKPPKKERRVEEREVWLVFYGNKVAICRRPERGLLAGLWEYPNQPAREGEGPPPAPVEAPKSVSFGAVGRHIFTHIEWRMRAWVVEAGTDDLPDGWLWADRRDLEQKYAIPSAFRDFRYIVDTRL